MSNKDSYSDSSSVKELRKFLPLTEYDLGKYNKQNFINNENENLSQHLLNYRKQ